jgi:hypothetical protein
MNYRDRFRARAARWVGAAGVALLMVLPFCSARAQEAPPVQPAAVPQTVVADAKPAVASSPAQQRKDQLAADAARLDQLAKELKIEMDKSTKDTLSMTVLKKAAEIEKLARKVREEIAQSLSN